MNPPSRSPGSFGVRTHLAVLSFLVIVFSLISGFVSWSLIRSESLWDAHFDQSLRTLSELPPLRAGIRRLDLTTELYLRTSDPVWLVRRQRLIENANAEMAEMAPEAPDPASTRLLKRARRDLSALVSSENRQIELKRRHGMADREAALSGRNAKEDLLESVGAIGDHAIIDIGKRVEGLWRSRYRYSLRRFFAEILTAFGVALYLFFFILRPFRLFHRAAESWTLGSPWSRPPLLAAPELRRHFELFGEMANRLNAQYAKEHELGELKTKLLSLVSHEFGNALAVIQNASILLEEKTPAGQTPEAEPFFRMIESNVRLLGTAVNNLLNLSRMEAGRFAMSPAPCDVAELLRDTAERLEVLADKKSIQLSVRFPEKTLIAKADPTLLSLALSNLLSNAIKYTPQGGEVVMGARPEPAPGFCRVYVKDTGIGIPPEEQDKIFGYYYRTERGKKMSARGFGIGLAVTRQIIEEHGGSLKIESVPDRGSTFSFSLPLWSD